MFCGKSVATLWQGGRLSEILSACPQPGVGVHAWLLSAAHQCRKAGLTEAEVGGPFADRMPRSATSFVVLTTLARTKSGERWLNPQCHLACAVFLRLRTDVPPASQVELVTQNFPRSPLTGTPGPDHVQHRSLPAQVQLTAACSSHHIQSTSTAAHPRTITHALLSPHKSSAKD